MSIHNQAMMAKAVIQLSKYQSGMIETVRSVLDSLLHSRVPAHFLICLNLPETLISSREHIVLRSGGANSPWEYQLGNDCSLCRGFYEGSHPKHVQVQNLDNYVKSVGAGPLPGKITVCPIHYQRKPLGVVALASASDSMDSEDKYAACKLLASEIAYQIKRYEFSMLIRENFGKDLMIIGSAQNMRMQDRFVEKASQVNLPAVILGEQGCEIEYVAYALHLGGARPGVPFVNINCMALGVEAFEEELLDSFAKANEGTVFFSDIDELSYKAQARLAEILSSRSARLSSAPGQENSLGVRVIASASRDLHEMAEERRFYQPLLKELDFLNTRIAPLRERREDIRSLVDHFLEKYRGDQTRYISDEALNLFAAYGWPGNVYELERVIARLVVMGEEEAISVDDVYDFAPNLTNEFQTFACNETVENQCHSQETPERQKGASGRQIDRKSLDLVDHLLKGQYTEIQGFHTGIQKVLEYLAANFQEEISLRRIAQHACLSPSHLCFLLQKTVGMSFKNLLAVIRIQKAKELLMEKPHMRITEISTEVGFGELSHFERTFKRIVKRTPREYRQAVIKQ